MKFEDTVKKLEQTVKTLSQGDLALDDSIALYKEGLDQVKTCFEQLQILEKEVAVLTVEENS